MLGGHVRLGILELLLGILELLRLRVDLGIALELTLGEGLELGHVLGVLLLGFLVVRNGALGLELVLLYLAPRSLDGLRLVAPQDDGLVVVFVVVFVVVVASMKNLSMFPWSIWKLFLANSMYSMTLSGSWRDTSLKISLSFSAALVESGS